MSSNHEFDGHGGHAPDCSGCEIALIAARDSQVATLTAELQKWKHDCEMERIAKEMCYTAWDQTQAELDAANERVTTLTAALEAALPTMQTYARENPRFWWYGLHQDPNGVHAWLKAHDAALTGEPEAGQ